MDALLFTRLRCNAVVEARLTKLCIAAIASAIILLLSQPPLKAETEVQGRVSGLWTLQGSPYVATDALMVSRDDTLKVEPGVEVRFDGRFPFYIMGALLAEGTEADSILFAPVAGADAWGGLRFILPDSATTLRYCIIRDGRTLEEDGYADSLYSGGNLYFWGGPVVLEHCRISRGWARLMGGGAAMEYASPVFRNCLFTENVAQALGGGISISSASNPEFYDCTVQGNRTDQAGGGVFVTGNSNPVFDQCAFDRNSSAVGGGLDIEESSSPVLRHCFITNNASQAGGGVYVRGFTTAPLFEWCRFYANVANDGSKVGGGIYIRGGASPEIIYCSFSENNANYGGGIYLKEPPRSKIHHCLFVLNDALTGGGGIGTSTDLGDTAMVISNCTFFNNRGGTGQVPYATAVLAREGSRVHLNNSIIWGEGPHFGAPGLVTASYCNIKYGFEGEGNSDLNPGFFEKDSSLLLLRGDSPCVDSGDPALASDPDSTVTDRGWLHFPQNAREGLSEDALAVELTTIDRTDQTLHFRNLTGVPIYTAVLDQWISQVRMDTVNVSLITGDSLLHGAAWTTDGVILYGSGGGTPKIYRLDPEFNLVGSFDQPGGEDDGFLDLGSDGMQMLYGANGDQIYEFTTEGEQGEEYRKPGGVAAINGLGVDLQHPYQFVDYYMGGNEGYIIRADDEMWERDRVQVGDSLRGLGVKGNSRALYTTTINELGNTILSLILPDLDLVSPLYHLNPPEGCRMGGFEVTQSWEPGRGTLVGLWEGEGDKADRLLVEDLYCSWLAVRPEWKLLLPGEETEWNITFAGDQMPAGLYESNLWLVVNGFGEGGEVFARMNNIQSGVKESQPLTPTAIQLGPIYPNPFNAQARYSFRLDHPGALNVSILDLQGREVKSLYRGQIEAGFHQGALTVRGLTTGSYFLQFDTGSVHCIQPFVVLK